MTTTRENVENPIERASRSFLMDFGRALGSQSELSIETIRERADSSSEVREGFCTDPFRHNDGGINE